MKRFAESLGDLAGHDILLARGEAAPGGFEPQDGLWQGLVRALRSFRAAPHAMNGQIGSCRLPADHASPRPEAGVLPFHIRDRHADTQPKGSPPA